MTPFIEVPTYESGEWTTTTFYTRDEFKEFITGLFKKPGQYGFDETSFEFNREARNFQQNKFYCSAPFRSKDFITYWDTQKERSRNGVIYKNKYKTWYLTRDYYFWINYLPIYDKLEKKFDFPKVWDSQYHMALYELLAELNYKHVPVLKKRQFGSSYFHMGKLLNQYWFEEGAVLKLGASLKDYINEKGSWKFLNEYRNFLNAHTAWYRPNEPDKTFAWQQQIKVRTGGRDTYKGLKSVLTGMSFEKDPTNGVGGPVTFFFHEEGGIAPKADVTFEFILPALKSGMITTGTFIIAGSVGDLDQCQPLKKMMLDPVGNDMYAIETDLLDDKGTVGVSGLFIPEQWSMPPYIDQYGNSQVEEALEAILKEREQWKKDLDPATYQLRISQKPTNIYEAFAARNESIFPVHLVDHQRRRIEDKQCPVEYVELVRDAEGKVQIKPSPKGPIKEWPVKKTLEDKTGVVCIYERPIPNVPWGTYFGSVDPVSEGKAEFVENLVYTPTGRKRIGDILPGDFVIGSNGHPTKVNQIFPQGIKDLYRVSFNDGSSVLVCEDHLWSVELNGGTRGAIVLSTKQLMNPEEIIELSGTGSNKDKKYKFKTYYKKPDGNSRWKIPLVQPIQFSTREDLPIPPYLLGLLLGDGGIKGRGIRFSTVDQELVGAVSELLEEGVFIKKIKSRTSQCDYSLTTGKRRNPLTKKLRDLGLQGKGSEDKFIPDDYKYASVSDRLELLRGLMDTDGYCGNHGAEYYSISKDLAYGVVELVQSLGGVAKVRKKIIKNTSLACRGKGYVYIVRVILPDQCNPFKLKRKAVLYYPPHRLSRYIKNIELESSGEAVCISVDAEDSLYVTENAIVTHNTKTSDSLCSIYIYKNPIEVIREDANGNKTSKLEHDGIVASWCGRFDDLIKTHERLEMLIELYNAWTIVECNVRLFNEYMVSRKKQKYLVPKDQIAFTKDILTNRGVTINDGYGWRNTGTVFSSYLISYAVQYLSEEIDSQTDSEGTTIKTVYGVERIPDPMLLEEMLGYQDKVNVDRLVAFSALIAFAKIQQANRGIVKRVEVKEDKLENSGKIGNLYKKNVFTNIGTGTPKTGSKPSRSAFRNLK